MDTETLRRRLRELNLIGDGPAPEPVVEKQISQWRRILSKLTDEEANALEGLRLGRSVEYFAHALELAPLAELETCQDLSDIMVTVEKAEAQQESSLSYQGAKP
jgi:hypothetical protein